MGRDCPRSPNLPCVQTKGGLVMKSSWRQAIRFGIIPVITVVIGFKEVPMSHAGTTVSANTKDRTDVAAAADAGKDAIRPFHLNFPEAELADLRKRINATKWPERETVTDASQGVQLATIQKLARYWGTEYNWSPCEARLNALPNFITEIDELDIHFIHVRSKHENALPVIVTHGWPGSVTEQLKIVDPLTNPTAHGGSASDAFHVVIPSMPGYGFSGKPTTTGRGPGPIPRAPTVPVKDLWDT